MIVLIIFPYQFETHIEHGGNPYQIYLNSLLYDLLLMCN